MKNPTTSSPKLPRTTKYFLITKLYNFTPIIIYAPGIHSSPYPFYATVHNHGHLLVYDIRVTVNTTFYRVYKSKNLKSCMKLGIENNTL